MKAIAWLILGVAFVLVLSAASIYADLHRADVLRTSVKHDIQILTWHDTVHDTVRVCR